jgi:DNA-binding response OmpR family regulator
MKILVVEDDVMLADFLEEALQDIGHNVCAIAGRVDDAVRLVHEHRPDIALLDMQLQGGEYGTDVADRLAATDDLRDMGILYVSGEANRVHRHARFGHACLNKPYSMESLATALTIVRHVADGTPWVHPVPRGIEMISQRTPASV